MQQQLPQSEQLKGQPGELFRQAKMRMASQGWHTGGVIPYGYRRCYDRRTGKPSLEVDPKQAEVVRFIFRKYLRDRSLARVTEALNQMAIPAPGGGPWKRASVSYLLSNPVYLGLLELDGNRFRGNHPALVAPIVYNKVQKIKRLNRRAGRVGRRKVVRP